MTKEKEKKETGLFPEKEEIKAPLSEVPYHGGAVVIHTSGGLPAVFDPNACVTEFFPPAENFDVMTMAPQLEKIKIAKEIQQFILPGDRATKELYAVIAAITVSRGFWPPDTWPDIDPALKGTKIPSCYSLNGITPAEHCKYSTECKTCRFNQWGSIKLINPDGGDRAKACKDTRKMATYILGTSFSEFKPNLDNLDFNALINQEFPNLLVAPPSSIKGLEKYLNLLTISQDKVKYPLAITKIGLQPVTGQKFEYCILTFERVGDIRAQFKSMDQVQDYHDKSEQFRANLQGQRLEHEDVVEPDPMTQAEGQPF